MKGLGQEYQTSTKDGDGITVRKLIDILQTFDLDLECRTEGCDCIGPCSGAEIDNWDDDPKYVLLCR